MQSGHIVFDMATELRTSRGAALRRARRCTFVMCPPEHFDVVYSINPWMDPSVPVDRARAQRQWEALVDVYRALGHEVRLVDPVPGLPDMVFAANSGFSLAGRVLTARFRHPERRPEERWYREWFEREGLATTTARRVNEGEGDFALVGSTVLAGYGIRTERAALREARAVFERPIVGLRLVDPRFYHLDTALLPLDDGVAYHPPAFSPRSRRRIEHLYPGALAVDERDAAVLGLNATCDGYHVVLPAQADGLAARLRAVGYEPVPVDVSELLKAGGSVKCCTLELRRAEP
jgi:N-dimethylarginine dimethylaminohydrolase